MKNLTNQEEADLKMHLEKAKYYAHSGHMGESLINIIKAINLVTPTKQTSK
tara:strand:+ start:359 stop:511 length:153 start_codon:yes stop_codon:yes gene_type:complete